MNKRILVLGATGFVGAPVARQLHTDGFTVRALVRDPRRLPGDNFETVVGTFEDEATLKAALAGCDAVHISVPWQFERRVVEDVVTILSRQGRKHVRISYISGATVLPENSGHPLCDEKLRAEEILVQSGIAYTILKPNWFMDALALFVRDGRATVFGRQRQPYHFLALADYACAVSRAHQMEAAANQRIVLHGPEALLISDALQRYCDAFHPGLKVTTLPIWIGKALVAMMRSAEMKQFIDMMAYFEKSPKVSELCETGPIPAAPLTTLDDWLRGRRS